MVYNAMKLFMEINPQLFDDCSHEYTEQQNSAAAREALRQRKWAAIQDQANRRKAANGSAAPAGPPPPRMAPSTLPRVDEVDTAEDNQKRLDSLKLQDGDRRDRRPGMHDRQNSVGSARSQR
jgi:serine/threonine-protein phosphatase 2A regulatory subunit B'